MQPQTLLQRSPAAPCEVGLKLCDPAFRRVCLYRLPEKITIFEAKYSMAWGKKFSPHPLDPCDTLLQLSDGEPATLIGRAQRSKRFLGRGEI